MKGVPHSVSARDFDCPSSPPLLSSLQFDWEGMTVRAYQKPKEAEQAISPTVPDVSLTLVTQGTLAFDYREVGDSWEAGQLYAGDWSLVPGGGQPHESRSHALSVEPVQSLLIHVNADFIARAASVLTSDDPARVEIRQRLVFQDPLLTQIGLALQHELCAPTVAGKLYAETAAQMLAVHLLRHYAQIDHPRKEETPRLTQQQVNRVREYVQHHLDQDLSLAELAQQSGFSPFHFARLFRQMTGESPHQYVVNRRLETAQRLLKETDLPLSQIALMTGFSSQSHFTRTLTRHLGQPPRQYRLRHSSMRTF
jgi:AraC family transcriptional regulator